MHVFKHSLLSNLSRLLRSEILLLTYIKHILKSVSGLAVQLNWYLSLSQGFAGGTSGKESTCQCRRHKRRGFDPWVGKIPWRRAWQTTPVFLLGESHGQRSLAGYSPWGHKESDMTEVTEHRHSTGPLSQWCCLTISSSASLFSFCLQSFLASGSFPTSWLFPSGGQLLDLQLQHQSFQWVFTVDFL